MPTPFTVADLLRFAVPTELALAPDGHTLAVSVQTQDEAADAWRSAIWMLDLDHPDDHPRQFTSGASKDRQPAWSPDGAWLAFTSDRAGKGQVWIMPAHGGEPRQVTDLRNGASRPLWAPDSRTLLLQSDVKDGVDPLAQDEKAKGQPKRDDELLRHVTRLQYRWDGGDILTGRTHLWTVDTSAYQTGAPAEHVAPRQITSGDYDHADAAWSPDGRQIAFVSDRNSDRDANNVNDVWVMTLATGALARLSAAGTSVAKPAWSPDGQMLAWYSTPDTPGYSASNTHIAVAARADGQGWLAPRDLLAGQDITLNKGITTDLASIAGNSPTWARDGAWLYAPGAQKGAVNIWRIRLAGGAAEPVTACPAQIGNFALAGDGTRLAAITTDALHPPEIALFDLAALPVGEPARWLTDLNPWLRERAIAAPRPFAYRAEDGWEMEGWALIPDAANEPGKQWPVILQIHGGPHGFYGPIFMGIMQAFAGAGYAVVYVNPRGSVGYGEAFERACDADWGGADYRDIMAGLDAALARFPLDPERMAVTGTSYGGYMTNWIIGHTERFKAAVTINSVTNLISSFGTSDVDAVFGLPEQGGTPWERMAFYIERSPVTHAPNITTPTRVIGAERDWRCPIEQSEQLFTALKMLGRVETDFIRVPDASHSINTGTPRQRVAQRRAILEWIQRFVAP